LYRAVLTIYEKSRSNIDVVAPVLGMSMRLILEVAGYQYFCDRQEQNNHEAGKFFGSFMKVVKRYLKDDDDVKMLSLESQWINKELNLEGIVHSWAHGNYPVSNADLIKVSELVGRILLKYFGKDRNDSKN
jgi:hypothetical protein